MFLAEIAGAVTFSICALFAMLYIPILYIFYCRKEFWSVLAYRFMFWIGVTDLGQLLIFALSGLMAVAQTGFFYFSINKFFGSTLYALWFAMLFLSMVTTINRFVSVVLSSYYSIVFAHLNVRLIYAGALLVFLIPWIVKLTPYSSYYFDPKSLKWTYHKGDIEILVTLSHIFGTYGIIVEVICAVLVYSFIAVHIFSRKKRRIKYSEFIATVQHFFSSLVFLIGFVYWEFVDDLLENYELVNFFSNLIWIIITGSNPIVYLIVNRRLRASIYALLMNRKLQQDRTFTVLPAADRNKNSRLIPPGEDGNGCVDMQCEDGMVCVQGQSGSKCMSKDPGNNCETTRCYAGSVCEYTETECLQDQACFAEPVCKRAGPREPPPEENSNIVDNNYGPGVQQDLPKGGDSASPQCAGRRNERYYQCKPCESTCVDWVMKRSPSCPNQKCVPGCACIPNWHRKNQPGQFSGTCVRPTWCNPITVTKTVTKVVQPTNTVPGPPAPTNPCATTVCNYGSTCQNQGGKAVCVRSQPPAGPSYPPSQPSPPSPRPGPSPPSYQPSGPSAPARPPAYGSGPGPTPPRPVNIGVPGVPVIPTGPFNPGGPVVPNPGYRPSATVQADAPRAGPTRCPANEVLTQCGGCEKQCQAGNPPKPVPICTSPRPCVRQCKCRPGFARINKVCTKENLCHTNYRPPLTVKTNTVVKTLPPKTVPGSPSPNQNPCASATCETGSTCQNVDGKAVCVAPPANPCANVVCEVGKTCQVSNGKGVCTASGGTPSYPPGDDPTGAAQPPCTAKCSANQRCVLKSDDNSCYNPPCPGVPTCVNVIAPQPSPQPVGKR
ncbi:hypothetical protein RB195_016114 [Necator americanus]|uniref:Follistatin-like domain-containing protein n=1 Tax=Necator americanus TaxID=51031 RepID=A0ABR1E7M3_NECAM